MIDNNYYGALATRLEGTPPASFLLDDFTGAAGAWSLRRLRAGYTGAAIRVRRTSDSAELDIGFTGLGTLDTPALEAWAAGTNALVTTWYDQTTNGRNAIQATAANQPRIVNIGVVTRGNNGQPAVDFLAGDQKLVIPAFITISASSNYSVYSAVQIDAAVSTQSRVLGLDTSFQSFLEMGQLTNEKLYDLQDVTIVSGTPAGMHIYENYVLEGTTSNYYDGVSTGGAATTRVETSSQLTIGGSSAAARSIDGRISEVVIYASNQTANRSGIYDNMNGWY